MDLSSNFNPRHFVLHRDKKTDVQTPWQRIFLVDGEKKVLPIAQSPKPSEPFYPDLPDDFFESFHPVTNCYPHKIYYEEDSRGNSSLPLIAITFGGSAPIIQPFDGGEVSIEMEAPPMITEIGFTLFRPKTTPVPEKITFLTEDKEVYSAKVNSESTDL